MPIENELKFVVRLDDKLEKEAKELGKCLLIEQGYIAEDRRTKIMLRLRKVTQPDGAVEHLMQMKCKAYKYKGLIEVGTHIDEKDFHRLWKLAKGKLIKSRYCIETGLQADQSNNPDHEVREKWELDFFKTEGKNYFVLAEIELPEEQDDWRFPMPGLIEGNVVYSVPRNDTRFSNRKLGNVEYATRLYKSVLHKELYS